MKPRPVSAPVMHIQVSSFAWDEFYCGLRATPGVQGSRRPPKHIPACGECVRIKAEKVAAARAASMMAIAIIFSIGGAISLVIATIFAGVYYVGGPGDNRIHAMRERTAQLKEENRHRELLLTGDVRR